MILTPLQKLSNNMGDLGKIIVATSFEWMPKVQKIAKSGHTGRVQHFKFELRRIPAGCTVQESYFKISNLSVTFKLAKMITFVVF